MTATPMSAAKGCYFAGQSLLVYPEKGCTVQVPHNKKSSLQISVRTKSVSVLGTLPFTDYRKMASGMKKASS